MAARQHFDRASFLKDLREPPVLKIDNNLDMEYGSKSAKLPATNYVAQTPPGFVLPRNQPEMTRAPTQGAKLHGYNTRNNDPHQRAEFDPPPDEVNDPLAQREELNGDRSSIWDHQDVITYRPFASLEAERLATPLSTAITVCSLITTEQFAPRLQLLDKSYSNTVPGFASTLRTKHPTVYEAFTAVLDLNGSAARAAFMAAYDELLAVFGGTAKPLFLTATATWILLSATSEKSAFLSLVLQATLWSPTEDVRAAVKNSALWSPILAHST